MRNNLQEYYAPSDEELNDAWSRGVLTLDANVLLNAYRYSQETRETLLKVLKKYPGAIWVSYQAALEYQRNRIGVILAQETAYFDLQSALQKKSNEIESILLSYKRHSRIDTETISNLLSKALDNVAHRLKEQATQHPAYSSTDPIRERITEIFEDCVGDPYSESRLKEIFAEGKLRYEKGIPPGFEDGKKGSESRTYGDLVMWYQIMDKAEAEKKPCIFVTDDVKEDWWWKVKGRTIGPRPELLKEFRGRTGQMIHIYQSDRFLEIASQRLLEGVKDESIQEVRAIREANEADSVKRIRRPRYTEQDLTTLIELASRYNFAPTYRDADEIAKEFNEIRDQSRDGGSIYMTIWRIGKGYYDDIESVRTYRQEIFGFDSDED